MDDDDDEGPFARVELELAVLMRRARAYSLDLARQVHPELQATAYAMLGRLMDLDGARSSHLSDYFGIDKGAVSRQVRLLEDLGLVAREPDPVDGRAQRLVVTERGAATVLAAREERHRLMRRLLADWDPEDVHALGALLARFNASMSATMPRLEAAHPAAGSAVRNDRPE